MQTLKAQPIWLAVIGTCALAGCIEARDTPGQGASAFISGQPTSSLDYGAGVAGGLGGTSSGGIGGAAGTAAGMSSLQPNPMSGAGGNGGAAGISMVTGGTGGTGGAGGTSGTGGTGGAGGTGGTSGTASGGGGGASGMEASGGASGAAGAGTATPGTLTLEFMSVGNAGEYAPRNVGVVWIETSSGTFVKTLERWAGIRANHLTAWTAASGGWGGGGFFFATGGGSADQMDAISAATLRPHQMHSPTWNMKDTMGTVVPDGTYRVMIEVTESERIEGHVASVEFEKGPAPVSLSPSDEGPFKDLTLSYTP
jgi:hypothetical protein